MSRFLVTGGAGFLGINLVRWLLDRGHEVTSLDIAPFDYDDCKDKVTCVTGDIRDPAAVAKATQGAEDSDLKPSQVKALLRQVQSGRGVEHVRNWLRYQSARVDEWTKSGLLDAIMDDIAALEADAEALTRTLYPERVEEQMGQVWLAMVERYTVYLHYRFAALKKGESDE